jgi:hypothetical protein
MNMLRVTASKPEIVMNIPSLEAIQQLDGKICAMLSPGEEEVLDFVVQQGRKFDVAVSVMNEARVTDLQAAGSSRAALTLLKTSNARVAIRLGQTASARYERLAKGAMMETIYIDIAAHQADLRGVLMAAMKCNPQRLIFIGSDAEIETDARESGHDVEVLPAGTQVPAGAMEMVLAGPKLFYPRHKLPPATGDAN